jgi:RimJ/RimL family protein N-acetyltransferase
MLTFREVDMSDARVLFDWRHQPHVAAMMATVMTDDFDAHTRWLDSARHRSTYYHWIFSDRTGDKGLVSIADIDPVTKSCSLGFYTGDENFGQLGALVPAYSLNFLLNEQNFERVTGEVFSQNESVLRMHDVLRYERLPERDRVVLRGSEELQLTAFEMSRENWSQRSKFHRWQSTFPMSHWDSRPEGLFVTA